MNPIDQSAGIKTQGNVVKPGAEGTRVSPGDTNRPGLQNNAAANGESVTFTRTAAELMQLESQLEKMPDVDHERVEILRRSIAEGSYEFRPERIADALIRAEQELY